MYDILIIGSGAAGLSAAVYASREMLKFAVIEKIFMGTGQIAESEQVDNYPGLYALSGFEIGEKLREHAVALGTEFINGDVSEIIPIENYYQLKLTNGKTFDTKTIVFASGAAHRKLGIKGEDEFTGRGVAYCAVCDAAFYRGKTVAVVGGGDSALGEAMLLSKFAEKVYLIHRSENFKANKLIQERLKNVPNVEIILNTRVLEIMGDKNVEKIKISQENSEKEISLDGVFVAIGSKPNSELLANLVELDKGGYVVADEDGITSAKGIFAAGDVRTKKLRQVITAASDGANCVISAEEYLNN